MFSTIEPAPAVVLPVIVHLQDVSEQVRNGNRLLIGLREELKETVTNMLERQVQAINFLADGSMTILTQCGFKLDKERTPTPVPERGVVVNVEDKTSGTAIFELKVLQFCKFYELIITGPNGYERVESSPFNIIKLANLPESVRLSVVARGVNRKGEGDWSAPLKFVVSINPNSQGSI